jgi:DNA-binding transcriptional regulator YiaG
MTRLIVRPAAEADMLRDRRRNPLPGQSAFGVEEACQGRRWGIAIENTMTESPELTDEQMARAIPARVRKRLILGQIESGGDVASLGRFVGLSQSQFAQAMGISVHTLRNWEQGRRRPKGPAIGLLRIAARHPRIIRENLKSAA